MSSRKTPISRVVRRIRALKPKTIRELRAAGIAARLLGTGAFRNGYKIRNCDLVVKFPLSEFGVTHSAHEMGRLRRLRRIKVLDRFLPEVYYYDKKSGVIVMKHYAAFRDFEEQADAMGNMIEKLIFRIARVKCTDIHTENIRQGRYPNARAVLVDLGL